MLVPLANDNAIAESANYLIMNYGRFKTTIRDVSGCEPWSSPRIPPVVASLSQIKQSESLKVI